MRKGPCLDGRGGFQHTCGECAYLDARVRVEQVQTWMMKVSVVRVRIWMAKVRVVRERTWMVKVSRAKLRT